MSTVFTLNTLLPHHALRFFKITGKLVVQYVSTYTEDTLKQSLSDVIVFSFFF